MYTRPMIRCGRSGVHKTFRFKLPAVRRTDRRRGVSDGRRPPAAHSDLESRGSSLDESVPLQPFSPFVDRLRPPAARSRPNHEASSDIGSDPVGLSSGPAMMDAGRVQAWRCSQGSLRKQSSIEETGEATGNGWRVSPAPPVSSRCEPGAKFFSYKLVKCCLSVCLDVNQGGTNRSRCT